MEGQKERNNSSPPKEDMSITRNGGCTGENGRIITSAASRLPFNGPTGAPSSLQLEDQRPCKKVVRYKECLKNYAAAIGGNATDGCGEFMPSGEQGTLEALKCSACSCHRNFHRKEIDGECVYDFYHSSMVGNSGSRIILGHHNGVNGSPQVHHINPLLSSKAPPPHQVIVSYRSGSVPSESDEKDDISHFQKTFFVQFEVNDSAQKRERIRKYCSCWRGVCGAWRSWAHSRLDGAMLVTGCWVKEEGIAEIIGNQVKWGDCCVFGTFLLAPKWLNQTSRYFWGRHYIYFTISVFYDVRTFPWVQVQSWMQG